jgi:hypothetical protein
MSEENNGIRGNAIHYRRSVEEVVDQGNLDVIDKLFTADYVDHGPVE